MNTPDILAATTPIVEAFEQLRVPYHIGGSVASSLYGIPRLTIDVDLVADLRLGQVQPLLKQLEATYYIDEDMIRDPCYPTSPAKTPANYALRDWPVTISPAPRT